MRKEHTFICFGVTAHDDPNASGQFEEHGVFTAVGNQ
jgi:hypothetical protein